MERVGTRLFGYTHSGSTYLLNVFLELGLCIYRGDFETFWKRRGDREYELDPAERIDLGVWFPGFQEDRLFSFASDARVCWSHSFPSIEDLGGRIILMTRDPRDALLSFAKRVAQDIQFSEFLRRPVPRADQGLLGLDPALEWALYYGLFTRVADPARLCVIRFEDMRADPRKEVERALSFTGVTFSASEIDAAIAKSSHSYVKAAADRWYARYPHLQRGDWRSMSRGREGQWKTETAAADLDLLAGLPTFVMKEHGYVSKERGDASVAVADRPPHEAALSVLTEANCSGTAALSPIAIESAFVNASASVGMDIENCIEAGKALACCRWTRELYGSTSFGSELAGKTLGALLDLSRYMKARPLVLVAAAGGLAGAGNRRAAHLVLEEALEGSGFYETVAIADCSAKAGMRRLATTSYVLAARRATRPSQGEDLALSLIRKRRPLLAISVLHASRGRGWYGLLRRGASDLGSSPIGWLFACMLPYTLFNSYRVVKGAIRRVSVQGWPGGGTGSFNSPSAAGDMPVGKELVQKMLDFSFLKNADWGCGSFVEDYLLLISTVANLKPRRILEIGTQNGLGAVVLAHAASTYRLDARVTTVDISQEKGRFNLHLIPGIENHIEFIEGNSNEVLPALAAEGRAFDLVFIDGAHDYEQARRDWENTQRLAQVWVLHDTTQFTGLQRLVREIRETGQYDVFQFVSGQGHRKHPEMTLERFFTGMTVIQHRQNLAVLRDQVHRDDQGRLLPGHTERAVPTCP